MTASVRVGASMSRHWATRLARGHFRRAHTGAAGEIRYPLAGQAIAAGGPGARRHQ